ncbi:MAG: hypothetical protein ACE5H7_05775 [Acidiferrobacterales bacterium]
MITDNHAHTWNEDFSWLQFERGQRYANHLYSLEAWIDDPDIRARVLDANAAALNRF